MKRTFTLALLMLAISFMAKAQAPAITWNPEPATDSTEGLVITYHPFNDLNRYSPATKDGDSLFKYNPAADTIWVYTYAIHNGTTYQFTPWGNVSDTSVLATTRVDSNDYTFTISNVRAFFEASSGVTTGTPPAQPVPVDTAIDSIAVIFRTADGDTQTVNLYVPLLQHYSTEAVTNVNTGNTKVSLYPNPASNSVLVSYSFAEKANTTVTITNLLGQSVVTQELGQKQSGNAYVSVSDIAPGVYIVTVTNGNNKVVQRLVKE